MMFAIVLRHGKVQAAAESQDDGSKAALQKMINLKKSRV